MSEDWSLKNEDAELEEITNVPEKTLEVPLTMKLDQKAMAEVKERVVKHFSKVKIGFLQVGAPSPEEVKLKEKELRYIPFWRVSGSYACRFVRLGHYEVYVSSDVEEVKINGKIQEVAGKRRRLADLVAEVTATAGVGYGPVKVSLSPLQDVMKGGLTKAFGSRNKEMGRQANLSVDSEELASYVVPTNLCSNANIGGEDKNMFAALAKTENFEPLSKETKSKSASVIITKEEVIQQFKKAACQLPDISPCRIIEQQLRVDRLELIYAPIYDFVVDAKGQRKRIRLNVLTDEDYIL